MPKPILMLVHGLVGSLNYFKPTERITRACVHTCDLLGYGKWKDVPPNRLTLDAQVGHVTRSIVELTDQPAWLLGHSMGGAITMLLADRHPELARGVINVEGNFTLKDAFWSSKIIAQSLTLWEHKYHSMQSDISAWLDACGIAHTDERKEWARQILAWQPAGTVYAMSRALVEQTRKPGYLQAVQNVFEHGTPVHLIAGEHSADAWDVPSFVRQAARSYTEMPGVGHLMMLEAPDEFCRAVDLCLGG